jgi:hypothetical protein
VRAWEQSCVFLYTPLLCFSLLGLLCLFMLLFSVYLSLGKVIFHIENLKEEVTTYEFASF